MICLYWAECSTNRLNCGWSRLLRWLWGGASGWGCLDAIGKLDFLLIYLFVYIETIETLSAQMLPKQSIN